MSLAADFVLAGFNELLTLPPEKIREIGITYAIPQIQESTIIELCNEAIVIMKSQPTLLKVEGECHVVGDLHGSLHDLIRFIIVSGISDTYLFLGDYVDRGSFSIETICLLLALYVKFPQNFI